MGTPNPEASDTKPGKEHCQKRGARRGLRERVALTRIQRQKSGAHRSVAGNAGTQGTGGTRNRGRRSPPPMRGVCHACKYSEGQAGDAGSRGTGGTRNCGRHSPPPMQGVCCAREYSEGQPPDHRRDWSGWGKTAGEPDMSGTGREGVATESDRKPGSNTAVRQR